MLIGTLFHAVIHDVSFTLFLSLSLSLLVKLQRTEQEH